MFYLCHAYLKGENFYNGRQPVLQEMEVTADHWVRFKTGNIAVAKQPMPFKTTGRNLLQTLKITFKIVN